MTHPAGSGPPPAALYLPARAATWEALYLQAREAPRRIIPPFHQAKADLEPFPEDGRRAAIRLAFAAYRVVWAEWFRAVWAESLPCDSPQDLYRRCQVKALALGWIELDHPASHALEHQAEDPALFEGATPSPLPTHEDEREALGLYAALLGGAPDAAWLGRVRLWDVATGHVKFWGLDRRNPNPARAVRITWQHLRALGDAAGRTWPPEPAAVRTPADARSALDVVMSWCQDRRGPARPAAKAPADDRDRWLYDQAIAGRPFKKILGELRDTVRSGAKPWEAITTENGIRKAAQRHAEANGLEPLPRRKGTAADPG